MMRNVVTIYFHFHILKIKEKNEKGEVYKVLMLQGVKEPKIVTVDLELYG